MQATKLQSVIGLSPSRRQATTFGKRGPRSGVKSATILIHRNFTGRQSRYSRPSSTGASFFRMLLLVPRSRCTESREWCLKFRKRKMVLGAPKPVAEIQFTKYQHLFCRRFGDVEMLKKAGFQTPNYCNLARKRVAGR